MGINHLLCLTLNTNYLVKQFFGKICLNLMDFSKIYLLSYYLIPKHINMGYI